MFPLWLLLTLWLSLQIVCTSNTGNAVSEGDEVYAVSLTTIPLRFGTVHLTVRSWLQQELRPAYVFIFVPRVYKRFRPKHSATHPGTGTDPDLPASLVGLLAEQLQHEPSTVVSGPGRPYLPVGSEAHGHTQVVVVSSPQDLGPALKHAGAVRLSADWGGVPPAWPRPTQWVACDDDVWYDRATLLQYSLARALSGPRSADASLRPLGLRAVLTHFSDDRRLVLKLRDEPFKRPVVHVQGVDTVCYPDVLLREHAQGRVPSVRSLSPAAFTEGLTWFHRQCPESFYQDDYIVSFLLNIADTDVRSIWNNHAVAGHLESASKSHAQMHMSPRVHERERATQDCVLRQADAAVQFLLELAQGGEL